VARETDAAIREAPGHALRRNRTGAAFYRDAAAPAGSLANYRQIQGKELSYNNIATRRGLGMRQDFREPACVIIKARNPCGVAVAADALEAYKGALATDPTSAFGASSRSNRPLDAPAAERLRSSSSRW